MHEWNQREPLYCEKTSSKLYLFGVLDKGMGMAEREKLHPIAKYNLEKDRKKHIKGASRGFSPALKKTLAERIVDDIPAKLLLEQAPRVVRSSFRPTETQKRMVWQMAAMGASWGIIRLAVLDPETDLPIGETTLDLHFREIMAHAREQANFTVALKIYELAVGQDAEYDNNSNIVRPYREPSLDALKWWDRTRGEAKKIYTRSESSTIQGDNNTVTLIIEGS